MGNIKAGVTTSEFLLVVLTLIGNIVAGVSHALNTTPGQHLSWGSIGLVALYTFSRSIVKISANKNNSSSSSGS